MQGQPAGKRISARLFVEDTAAHGADAAITCYPHRAPSRYPFAAQSGLAPGNPTLFPAFANWFCRTPP
jgi:hypothetical protein